MYADLMGGGGGGGGGEESPTLYSQQVTTSDRFRSSPPIRIGVLAHMGEVECVLYYLLSLGMHYNCNLSLLKQLSAKLAVLLALAIMPAEHQRFMH